MLENCTKKGKPEIKPPPLLELANHARGEYIGVREREKIAFFSYVLLNYGVSGVFEAQK